MNSKRSHIAHDHSKRRVRSGLTLVELLVCMVASAILLAGISSALVLVSRAGRWGPAETVQTGTDVGDILAELNVALVFRERSTRAVEFAVSDRDGDGQPEWIRYAWSGVPGDPLTRQVNGGPIATTLDNVHALLLQYFLQPADSDKARVLLVVPNAASLSSQDAAKRSWLESWGYRVQPISASSPPVDFTAADLDHDVAYISEETIASDLNTKLLGSTLGVVNEERFLYDEFEIASNANSNTSNDIIVTNNVHYITSKFALGPLSVCEPQQQLISGSGTTAPGTVPLGRRPYNLKEMLLTLETGALLNNGEQAAGRRVMLPWGGNSFDFHSLTHDAHILLDRALTWAAGDMLVGVGLSIQQGPSDYDHVLSRTVILNRPRVSGP